MSDTTASLRRKIGSAGDLQSVVRTMKALAARFELGGHIEKSAYTAKPSSSRNRHARLNL